jgi:hypothetical protein
LVGCLVGFHGRWGRSHESKQQSMGKAKQAWRFLDESKIVNDNEKGYY